MLPPEPARAAFAVTELEPGRRQMFRSPRGATGETLENCHETGFGCKSLRISGVKRLLGPAARRAAGGVVYGLRGHAAGGVLPAVRRAGGRGPGARRQLRRDRGVQRRDLAETRLDGGVSEARGGLPAPQRIRCGAARPAPRRGPRSASPSTRANCSATSTTRVATAERRARRPGRFRLRSSGTAKSVALDDRSARRSTSSGWRPIGRAAAGWRLRRCARRSGSMPRFAEAHYVLGVCLRAAGSAGRGGRRRSSGRWRSPRRCFRRAKNWRISTRSSDATTRGLPHLEALAALQPAPARERALGLGYARAGHLDRAVGQLAHASQRYPG